MRLQEMNRKIDEIKGLFARARCVFVDDRDFPTVLDHLRNPRESSVKGISIIPPRMETEFSNIDVAGYFSEGAVEIFGKYARVGIKIRLLSPELTNSRQDRKNIAALRKLQDNGVEVKFNSRIHSRMLISYQKNEDSSIGNYALLLGSFDFNREGLSGERRDAGIITRSPDLVEAAYEFFNNIWHSEYETETLDEKYPKK